MVLTKYKLGELIEEVDLRNKDIDNKYTEKNVKGISTNKEFIETKANLVGVSLNSYRVVNPMNFAYVTDTSRRGDKISLAFNNTNEVIIVSSISTIFKVKREELLDPSFLFMYFNRPEFDRFSRFNSWGSARETFSWEDFCDIEINLPSIAIQKKYVAIYQAMLKNQEAYEEGLEDLKLACDAYLEKIKEKISEEPLESYIKRNNLRNNKNNLLIKDVKGFNNEGEFINPMRLFSGDISTFKIIKKDFFVYNSRINSNIKRLSVAINEGSDLLVSPAYETFYVSNTDKLIPYYLYMLLQKESFARKVLFNSYGSSTLVFVFNDLSEIELPIPKIKIQESIANIYKSYKERRAINETLKNSLKKICPILIKGAMEEASRKEE